MCGVCLLCLPRGKARKRTDEIKKENVKKTDGKVSKNTWKKKKGMIVVDRKKKVRQEAAKSLKV